MSITATELHRRLAVAESGVLEAFLRIVRRIVNSVRLAALFELLDGPGNEDIPAMLRLDDRAMSPLTEAVRSALVKGGESVEEQSGVGALIQFDMRNRAVESWTRRHGSELVTDIIADQREAIRVVVSSGIEAGRNPKQIALDIIGRMDKATGRRMGGIVGLTKSQAVYVTKARKELESLSPEYFRRKRRDKRFDSVVRRAIESGNPLTNDQIDKIVGRYSDLLLQLRGETIARTESLQAFNAGRELAMSQAIASGTVKAENVTGTWKTAVDPRVRETHHDMQGQTIKFGDVFVSPSGARFRYPGDTSLGAPAEEIIQCRCVQEYKINWLAEGLGNGA